MPTPVGHALGGFAFGWLIAAASAQARPSASTRSREGATATAAASGVSWLARIREQLREGWPRPAMFAALGALPDIDLLFHAHGTYTHSVGAALLAGLIAWPFAAFVNSRSASAHAASAGAGTDRTSGTARATPTAPAVRPRSFFSTWSLFSTSAIAMALACAAAYGSHVLLDWLGTDTSPPYGITALWPFSSAYFYSALDLFPAVDRRYWLPDFWLHDLAAIGWELLVLLPIAVLALWLRAPRDHA